jgi:2-Cys peroxiredoxin 5
MFLAKRLTTRASGSVCTQRTATAAQFHSSRPSFVKAGDRLPDLNVLVEDSPGNKVNLSQLLAKGKGVVVGTPAAFSMLLAYTFLSF